MVDDFTFDDLPKVEEKKVVKAPEATGFTEDVFGAEKPNTVVDDLEFPGEVQDGVTVVKMGDVAEGAEQIFEPETKVVEKVVVEKVVKEKVAKVKAEPKVETKVVEQPKKIEVSEGEKDLLQTQLENDVVDEKSLDTFKEFVRGNNYIVFKKRDVAHFLDLVSYHSKLGFDTYTMSFKMDMTEAAENKCSLVYNNGSVLAISTVGAIINGVPSSYIISVDTMLKIYNASSGYIMLYEEEGNIYGYVFGGKVYIETFKVETDICSKEYLVEQMAVPVVSSSEVDPLFINTLRTLYDIVRTGSRIEEKAIYFEGEDTYIYAGMVMGKFKGVGISLTLQDVDISTVARYFFDVDGKITISDHDLFLKITYKNREVYLAKRGLKLSEDMRYTGIESKDGVQVQIGEVQKITNFLLNMSNNTGVLNLQTSPKGLVLSCQQKALDYLSTFYVDGVVHGNGIGTAKIPLDVLKTFTRIFGGNVLLRTDRNKTYISGDIGSIVIFGNL